MAQNPLPYRFIVLDGPEGCGKSTQVQLLARRLQGMGEEVVVTHEPGGTPTGEAIRSILLDADLSMSALTEALLFCASRAQHMQDVIMPALQAGKVVVCDRFSASTAAYQGYAGDLGWEVFKDLDDITTGGQTPDITVILDLDPVRGRQRQAQLTLELAVEEETEWGAINGPPDRMERKGRTYHQRVRKGFLEYARRLGERAAVVDADRSVEEVHQQILQILGLN